MAGAATATEDDLESGGKELGDIAVSGTGPGAGSGDLNTLLGG